MSLTGYCVSGDHEGCPDSVKDDYECDCPCHLLNGSGNSPSFDFNGVGGATTEVSE